MDVSACMAKIEMISIAVDDAQTALRDGDCDAAEMELLTIEGQLDWLRHFVLTSQDKPKATRPAGKPRSKPSRPAKRKN